MSKVSDVSMGVTLPWVMKVFEEECEPINSMSRIVQALMESGGRWEMRATQSDMEELMVDTVD